MRPTVSAVLLVLAAALPGFVHAERADREKPMNIEADALRYDDLRQTSVFTGRVVLTKGTILIRGARLDVRQDAEGYQYGVVTAEPGKRAFYRQKREGVDEFIEGEGEVIEYDGGPASSSPGGRVRAVLAPRDGAPAPAAAPATPPAPLRPSPTLRGAPQ